MKIVFLEEQIFKFDELFPLFQHFFTSLPSNQLFYFKKVFNQLFEGKFTSITKTPFINPKCHHESVIKKLMVC